MAPAWRTLDAGGLAPSLSAMTRTVAPTGGARRTGGVGGHGVGRREAVRALTVSDLARGELGDLANLVEHGPAFVPPTTTSPWEDVAQAGERAGTGRRRGGCCYRGGRPAGWASGWGPSGWASGWGPSGWASGSTPAGPDPGPDPLWPCSSSAQPPRCMDWPATIASRRGRHGGRRQRRSARWQRRSPAGQGGTLMTAALPQPLPHTERQADPIRLPPPGPEAPNPATDGPAAAGADGGTGGIPAPSSVVGTCGAQLVLALVNSGPRGRGVGRGDLGWYRPEARPRSGRGRPGGGGALGVGVNLRFGVAGESWVGAHSWPNDQSVTCVPQAARAGFTAPRPGEDRPRATGCSQKKTVGE